ncbi:TPA: response regulator [Listeria monocytogenes]|nr:response regulator [Listeria monocytogenes]HDU7307156.1 response regulator [Listeria monocytogenes]HDU7459873.1 response regulator [Listeria monocytogenes]HEM0838297.1 response regulator [Listeria monocytogenes]HEM1131963.1 response regulator [Listeria monocytogenes]
MNRKDLKDKQWEIILQIEKCKKYTKRKQLIQQLERLEAYGDRRKGMATPTQVRLILSVNEYRELSKKLTDLEIAEKIGISRSSLVDFKKKNGLLQHQGVTT